MALFGLVMQIRAAEADGRLADAEQVRQRLAVLKTPEFKAERRYKNYLNAGGETEARAVQERRNYGPLLSGHRMSRESYDPKGSEKRLWDPATGWSLPGWPR
jgi:hypothetical protein